MVRGRNVVRSHGVAGQGVVFDGLAVVPGRLVVRDRAIVQGQAVVQGRDVVRHRVEIQRRGRAGYRRAHGHPGGSTERQNFLRSKQNFLVRPLIGASRHGPPPGPPDPPGRVVVHTVSMQACY